MASSVNASNTGFGGILMTGDSSGQLQLQTAGTTALTIDTSQNVGIGTTTPSNALQVTRSSGEAVVGITNSGTGSSWITFTPGSSGGAYLHNTTASSTIFTTSGTERMRIDSSGNVLMGTTSLPTNSGKLNVNGNIAWGDQSGTGRVYSDANWGCILQASKASPNVANFLFLRSDGGLIFAINAALGTGTVYSNGGYLTNTNPSDETLKTNIQDLSFGLDFINQLKPVSFNWIDDVGNQGKQYGFIAQDVQKINPEIVKEFTYNPPSSSDNPLPSETKLGLEEKAIYTALVKAIQEQQTIINDLKARVTALEAK